MFTNVLQQPDTSGTLVGDFVDVRDVAELHIRSLEVPEAAGERIFGRAGAFSWQDYYDVLGSAGLTDVGKETRGTDNKEDITYSAEKSLKIFPGFQYTDFKTSVLDMAKQFKALGVFA